MHRREGSLGDGVTRECELERGESLVCMTLGSTSLLSMGIISGLCLGSASLTCHQEINDGMVLL